MKIKFALLSITTATVLAIGGDSGDQGLGLVAAKPALTLQGAKLAGDAAAKYAGANDAVPAIAVVDEGGYLLYFSRPETGFAASAQVSIGKARTSAIFKKPTKDFEQTINQGRFTMTALTDFTPLQGGVPIVQNGRVVGAIGVSGAKSAQQDEEVAKAGAAALAEALTRAR